MSAHESIIQFEPHFIRTIYIYNIHLDSYAMDLELNRGHKNACTAHISIIYRNVDSCVFVRLRSAVAMYVHSDFRSFLLANKAF